MGILDKLKQKYANLRESHRQNEERQEFNRYSQEVQRSSSPQYKKALYGARQARLDNLAAARAKRYYGPSRIQQAMASKGRVPQRLTQAIASAGGVSVPYSSRGQNKGYGRRGRPKGAYDGRYAAYGGVYGYRKALAQQRRLALLKAQQEMGQAMQQQGQVPNQYNQAPPMPMQRPATQQIPFQANQQSSVPMPQQPNPQLQQSQTGVSLWDNSFMKLDTGQSNIQKTPGGSMWGAFNPETPSGEPGGDYYTEPDFFSGKQVLRRRSGDKLFKW